MNTILNLIHKNDWYTLVKDYNPKTLAQLLPFKEARSLAHKMLFNEKRDDTISVFATELLQEIRQIHSEEWLIDWKNDVFLGDACYMSMMYDEQYEAYKRAFEKTSCPPPSLLISLGGCYLSPESPITLNEAEILAKKALDSEMSIEGVVLLRGIYAEKEDQVNFDYWDKVFKEVEIKNIHTQNAWPDFSKV